jgi:ATP-binding cassette subfamily B protein/subfamily B ATP-binding cassette protein MsbA
MKSFFRLLKPYKLWFLVALLALIFSAFFNAALTGMVAPLMNNVMTDQPEGSESRADEIFGYKEKLESLKDWLEARGVPIQALEAQSKGPDLLNPLPWALMVFIIFCLQALFDFLGTYTMGRVGLWVVVHLRQSIIDRLLFLSMRFFKNFSTGEILTRINTDVLRVQNAISVKLGEMIKEFANSAVFLVFAFVLNWKLSLTFWYWM